MLWQVGSFPECLCRSPCRQGVLQSSHFKVANTKNVLSSTGGKASQAHRRLVNVHCP